MELLPRKPAQKTPSVHWLEEPYINLDYVAGQLYGHSSRLHTKRLRDRLRGRFTFSHWEVSRLQELKDRIVQQLNQ